MGIMPLKNTNELSLKEKHRQYNEDLKRANTTDINFVFDLNENDVENMKKIDIASEKKDVDYILSILKCEDMLYVSRALKRCSWLTTDQQYADIINPQYIETQLQPYMTIKNYLKLIKHIRLTLKDETRAEQFYESEKNPIDAVKWLPICSVPFIEQNVGKHVNILKIRLFKRLCERSFSIFEIIMNNEDLTRICQFLESVTFLLHSDIHSFLDILENLLKRTTPKLTSRATALIMKRSPKRIMDKFKIYMNCVHLPTFVKFLPKDKIKSFLYEQAKHEFCRYDSRMNDFWVRHFHHFIERLPKEEQFVFVKDVFIAKKEVPQGGGLQDTEEYGKMKLCETVRNAINYYMEYDDFFWYKYAPFEQAFQEFEQRISKESDLDNKEHRMMTALIKWADNDHKHISSILQYFVSNNKNYSDDKKAEFIIALLSHTNIHEYNETAWNTLNQLYVDLKVYDDEEDCPYQEIIRSIIVYSLLHEIPIAVAIEKKFEYITLETYQKSMSSNQKEIIFNYLLNHLINQINETTVTCKEQFSKVIQTLESILRLMVTWEKELIDYPIILNKIKEFAKIKRENSWNTDLSSLYDMKKSWRRHMFEESLVMSAREETCLNALKHQPSLLTSYNNEVNAVRFRDNVNLGTFLAKLRVYYPKTIAQQWIDQYNQRLKDVIPHRAPIRGLCILQPHNTLMSIIKENAPETPKIDWNQTDERVISLRRFLAKNMHVARPQPNPDAVLLYAKGDYLQFALPSLLAIFYNLNPTFTRLHIPKLLDAPVSLQKHGIRLAYRKFDHDEHKEIFINCWKASKNLSIRALIFKFTYNLLCKEKHEENMLSLWELTKTFIGSLSFEEDKTIYELLFKVNQVPFKVRAEYLMISYRFLKRFLPHAKSVHINYAERIASLGNYTREVIEFIHEDFVTDLINEHLNTTYFNVEADIHNTIGMINVISAYLLCCKDAETQTKKYEEILKPLLDRSLTMWNEKRGQTYVIRVNLEVLLKCLSTDLIDYVAQNDVIVPKEMFAEIQKQLEKHLPISENYILLTGWKLVTALAQEIDQICGNWDKVISTIAPHYGNICLKHLKEDVKSHFSCIYVLFAKAMEKYVLGRLVPHESSVKMYKQMLADSEFTEGNLAVINMCYDHINASCDGSFIEIQEILSTNNSVEVRFHYYNRTQSQF